LRRASPIWWYRRLEARLTVTVVSGTYDNASYQERIFMIGNEDVGHVVFQICRPCRAGYIGKISVYEPYQDRGIATRALADLRAEVPGYRWSTSGQYSTARTFWRRTSRQAGGGYETAGPCEHIDPPGRRPGQAATMNNAVDAVDPTSPGLSSE
jgi:hypothetical protein